MHRSGRGLRRAAGPGDRRELQRKSAGDVRLVGGRIQSEADLVERNARYRSAASLARPGGRIVGL